MAGKEKKKKERVDFIPTIDVDLKSLPSKGVPYSKDAKISYRTYTWGEVQQVSTSIRKGYHSYLRYALMGVKTTGLSPLDLTLSDAIYLGMLRKINSLGGIKVELEHICQNPKCGKELKTVFTHNDINFVDMKAKALPATVELSNDKTYTFMPLTVGSFFDIMEGKKKLNGKKIEDIIKDKIALLSAMVTNIKFEEVYADFSQINDYEDAEIIEEVDTALHSDIRPFETKCDECGTEQFLVLEGKEHLLKPFRDGRRNNRRRIQFGNEHESVALGNEAP